MPNINITVAEKIATNTTPGVVIVCGNSDYTVSFAFDDEWAAETDRVARFVYYKDGLSLYQEVTFTGNTVAVPILSGVTYVLVGVYAGNLRTTTPAKVLCDRSILCGDPLEVLTPQEKAALQAQIGDLSQLSTEDKANLVAAINEAAKSGEIPDGSVTPEKTTFFDIVYETNRADLYDATTTQWGYYSQDGTTLKTYADTKYGFTDYIAIVPNAEYLISGVQTGLSPKVFYYDKAKTLLGSVTWKDADTAVVVSDESAAYIRFNATAYGDGASVSTESRVLVGMTIKPEYIGTGNTEEEPEGESPTFTIPDGSVTPEKTTFMEVENADAITENVYDVATTQWGYYTTDGTNLRTISDNKYGVSDYIEIYPNSDISIAYIAKGLSAYVFYYDADKNLLGSVLGYDTATGATIKPLVITDENAKYIRFNDDGYLAQEVWVTFPNRAVYVLPDKYLPGDLMRKSEHLDFNREKWKGLKITVDGDSITDSLYTPWWSYLQKWFGLSEVQNCAASGKTIIEDRGDGRTCLERVAQDYAADTSAILLMGAGNSGTTTPGNEDDTFEDGTFYGKMNGLVDKLRELFPLVPVVLIATPPRMNQPNLFNQYEQLRTIAANKKTYFIDCFHGALNPDNEANRAAFIPDGVHPNEKGNQMIAQTIFEELKKVGVYFE